ncbi:Trk K+ transport system, NAD-binding component [Geodermatophilus telluris]|uniref:Trk K+ transport system, NAD-binding component n=1 Tax=Geodermatophilus telluris TaxID=1190417 RepID=A0A1G6VAV8_9ACTN|nr:NAD-binding protein [Geodermatophilus telluris]SDD50533.1 Trk K+ transport system, NAD-binding component [Geodermatophilus telluris]
METAPPPPVTTRGRRGRRRAPVVPRAEGSATVFVVLRRMRAPLITLITIFAVSVLGLSLVPGVDAQGQPARLSLFDAFYVMSYTATTIGFGEIPYSFSYAQRMWVTGTIYLTVIGWAYAIGSLLSLVQDRAFRQALTLRHVSRKVTRLREPFLLVAGYGQAGETLGEALDALGRRFTVVDISETRIDTLEIAGHRADVPGVVGDARDPHVLGVAGLGHPYCEGVLALTGDDEANLAVAMAAALLRPELPLVTRTTSATVAERMARFGAPTIVNPFDRFGDHLRLALRTPASYQLMTWLESGPGAELTPRGTAPAPGRWVVCGYGRFGRHFAADLRAEGLEVTTVDPSPAEEPSVVGDAADPDVIGRADLATAVGLVAGTDNDTTNLSLVAEARRTNPGLFVAARQNQPADAALFAAMDVDALLVPTEVVAHDAYARLSTPLLWRFLRELPRQSDEWSAGVVDRLLDACGRHLEALWKVRLTPEDAPALHPRLSRGGFRLADLLRDPADRDQTLLAVPLLVLRGDEATMAPGTDLVLEPGDELLFAGRAAVHREVEATLFIDGVADYLATGQRVPSSWIWRRLSRSTPAPDAPAAT